jgi:hypothetical protein
MALFIPGFSGEEHAARAVAAARHLLEATGNDRSDPRISLGAGVHTGVAYVGTVGEGDVRDFTALGDPVNIAARLASVAQAGELLVKLGSRLDRRARHGGPRATSARLAWARREGRRVGRSRRATSAPIHDAPSISVLSPVKRVSGLSRQRVSQRVGSCQG